ncbi:MAG: O-antigen ligase family protein [Oligoflexales bacterium]
MNIFFLIIPWSLFLGIAGQTFALYLCTTIFLLSQPREKGKNWMPIGLSCIGIWGIFPILSTFNQLTSPTEGVIFQDMIRSHIPSSLLIFGFLICSIPRLPFHHKSPPLSSHKLLISSALSLSVILLIALFQHFTGWDYRLPQGLGSGNLINDGYYRIRLFHGHPLSLASVCLTWLTFLLFIPGEKTHQTLKIHSIICTGIILILTGGRSALLIAFCFLLFAAFSNKKIIYGSFLLIISFFILKFLGLLDRFFHFSWSSPRFRLWEVHWNIFLSRPWSGVGYHAIAKLRPEYSAEIFYDSPAYITYNAHQLYLETLSEIGFLGFSFILFCSWIIVQSSYRILPLPPFRKLIGSLIGVNLLHGLTQNTYFDASVMAATLSCIILSLKISTEKNNVDF